MIIDNFDDKFYKKLEEKEKDWENIFNDEINSLVDCIKKNKRVIVWGDVQSGKTRRIISLKDKFSKNRYFNVIIIFGGINVNLYTQTKERSMKTDIYTSDYVYCDSDNIKNLNITQQILENKVVVINVKKTFNDTNNLLSTMKYIDIDSKILVIDDECDYASINVSNKKGENSKIYDSISTICKRKNTWMCMFTATPYANIINSNSMELRPRLMFRLNSNPEYTGNIFFLDKGKKIYKIVSSKNESNILENNILERAFKFFVYSVAIYNFENDTDKGFEFLINVDLKKEEMNQIFKKIKEISEDICSEISIKSIDNFEKIFAEQITNYSYIYEHLTKTKVKEYVSKILNDFFVDANRRIIKLYDSDNVYISEDYERSRFNKIIISGSIASRGFTFNNLMTQVMINSPEKKIAIDTLAQRARWFGYRNNHYKYMKVFITKNIYESFNDMKNVDDYMKSKMKNSLIELDEYFLKEIKTIESKFTCSKLTGGKKSVNKIK